MRALISCSRSVTSLGIRESRDLRFLRHGETTCVKGTSESQAGCLGNIIPRKPKTESVKALKKLTGFRSASRSKESPKTAHSATRRFGDCLESYEGKRPANLKSVEGLDEEKDFAWIVVVGLSVESAAAVVGKRDALESMRLHGVVAYLPSIREPDLIRKDWNGGRKYSNEITGRADIAAKGAGSYTRITSSVLPHTCNLDTRFQTVSRFVSIATRTPITTDLEK